MYYSKALGELAPQFDECPAICADSGERRQSECDECPKRELREGFREDSLEFLKERLGDRADRYNFDTLYADLIDVLEIEASVAPDRWTLTAAKLVEIVTGERDKKRRLEEWNRRQRAKSQT